MSLRLVLLPINHMKPNNFSTKYNHFRMMLALEVNISSYSLLLRAFLKCEDRSLNRNDLMERAEYYLHQMEQKSLRPEIRQYNAVLDGWIHSNQEGGALDRADAFLDRLVERYWSTAKTQKPPPQVPTTYSFQSLLSAHANMCRRQNMSQEGIKRHGRRFYDLLHIMEKISQHQRENQRRLKSKINVQTKSSMYNMLLDIYANLCIGKEVKTMSKSRRQKQNRTLIIEAEKILQCMEDTHSSNLNPLVRPDKFTFSALMKLYAKSTDNGVEGDVSDKVDMLIQKAMRYQEEIGGRDSIMDGVLYAWTIAALAQSQEIGSVDKALAFLDDMKGKEMTSFKTIYSSTIGAWANQGTFEGLRVAEELLYQLEERYRRQQNQDSPHHSHKNEPDAICYNILLDAMHMLHYQSVQIPHHTHW